jgi:two-component system, sensor histidine kinase LadS
MQLRHGFGLLLSVLKVILTGMSLWLVTLVHAQNQLPSLFASSKMLSLPDPVMVLSAPADSIKSPDSFERPFQKNQWAIWQPGFELPTSPETEVWVRLVIPQTPQAEPWTFRIPRISLDKATFYRLESKNTEAAPALWQSFSAGMTIPNTQWPMPTRDPVFSLTTRTDQTQLFYIQVQHRVPVTENLQLIHINDLTDGANRVGTLSGLLIGLFIALICVCLISGWINRSAHFYWFALFAFSVMLTQLTLLGYMGLRIWPGSIYMARVSGWFFPMLSLAALARFCLSVSYAKELSVVIFRCLWALIGLCLIIAVVVLATAQGLPQMPLNAFFGIGMLAIVLMMAWLAWRSQHWLWPIVLSLIPIILSAMARLAYNQGWVAHVELAQLAGVITASLGLLAIYATMILHSRERLTVSLRQQALEVTSITSALSWRGYRR